ncbi:hypothetical protein GKQ38_00430 [Candidatus Nanohaloarchaea archaeon]|nr:hypothetical protein GKQ38_00430 [Candidatus Nanohaloarchaea archaeon]
MREINTLKEDASYLSDAEVAVENGGDYTFGDLREDVDDYVALSMMSGVVDIDEEQEEIVMHENAFDYALDNEAARRGVADRPLGLETAVLGGSGLGLAGSAWKFLEDGDPMYLGTGGLSLLAGRSAFKRISSVLSSSMANDKASDKLDMYSHLESYSLRTVEPEEARKYMAEQLEGKEDGVVKAYTADELEDMSMEALEQELEEEVEK